MIIHENTTRHSRQIKAEMNKSQYMLSITQLSVRYEVSIITYILQCMSLSYSFISVLLDKKFL